MIDTDYERWRELKRLVIVYGLPRDEFTSESNSKTLTTTAMKAASGSENDHSVRTADVAAAADIKDERREKEARDAACSLRGRIWKVFLGVDTTVNTELYAELVGRGASYCDGDIRNDTFRCAFVLLYYHESSPSIYPLTLICEFVEMNTIERSEATQRSRSACRKRSSRAC